MVYITPILRQLSAYGRKKSTVRLCPLPSSHSSIRHNCCVELNSAWNQIEYRLKQNWIVIVTWSMHVIAKFCYLTTTPSSISHPDSSSPKSSEVALLDVLTLQLLVVVVLKLQPISLHNTVFAGSQFHSLLLGRWWIVFHVTAEEEAINCEII